MMQGSLAGKLRALRARRGYTLTEAAAKTGVDRGTLSSLERGVHSPYTPTLHKIARGYEIPVEDLLVEESAIPLGEEGKPKLEEWLQEEFAHAHLALPREELKRQADDPVFRAECREELEGVARLRKQHPPGAGDVELFAGGETYSRLQRRYLNMVFASSVSDEEVEREEKRVEELVV